MVVLSGVRNALGRLVSLVQEVEEVASTNRQPGQLMWEEGYSAPLYARIYMRLGMWKWTITSSEACRLPPAWLLPDWSPGSSRDTLLPQI